MTAPSGARLYAVFVNLAGIHNKVFVLKYDPQSDCWWDSSGNWDAPCEGLHENPGRITFASRDRATAEAYLAGLGTARKMLKEWLG